VPNSDGSGNSTTVPVVYQTYTANFMATVATTYLTFALRDDKAFLFLDDISLTDLTTPSGNLLLNGDFSGGVVGTAPANWTYLHPAEGGPGGGTGGGGGGGGCGPGGVGNCYNSGATQGYDGITQPVATAIGDTYQLTFKLNGGGGLNPTTFSALSNNGNIINS